MHRICLRTPLLRHFSPNHIDSSSWDLGHSGDRWRDTPFQKTFGTEWPCERGSFGRLGLREDYFLTCANCRSQGWEVSSLGRDTCREWRKWCYSCLGIAWPALWVFTASVSSMSSATRPSRSTPWWSFCWSFFCSCDWFTSWSPSWSPSSRWYLRHRVVQSYDGKAFQASWHWGLEVWLEGCSGQTGRWHECQLVATLAPSCSLAQNSAESAHRAGCRNSLSATQAHVLSTWLIWLVVSKQLSCNHRHRLSQCLAKDTEASKLCPRWELVACYLCPKEADRSVPQAPLDQGLALIVCHILSHSVALVFHPFRVTKQEALLNRENTCLV